MAIRMVVSDTAGAVAIGTAGAARDKELRDREAAEVEEREKLERSLLDNGVDASDSMATFEEEEEGDDGFDDGEDGMRQTKSGSAASVNYESPRSTTLATLVKGSNVNVANPLMSPRNHDRLSAYRSSASSTGATSGGSERKSLAASLKSEEKGGRAAKISSFSASGRFDVDAVPLPSEPPPPSPNSGQSGGFGQSVDDDVDVALDMDLPGPPPRTISMATDASPKSSSSCLSDWARAPSSDLPGPPLTTRGAGEDDASLLQELMIRTESAEALETQLHQLDLDAERAGEIVRESLKRQSLLDQATVDRAVAEHLESRQTTSPSLASLQGEGNGRRSMSRRRSIDEIGPPPGTLPHPAFPHPGGVARGYTMSDLDTSGSAAELYREQSRGSEDSPTGAGRGSSPMGAPPGNLDKSLVRHRSLQHQALTQSGALKSRADRRSSLGPGSSKYSLHRWASMTRSMDTDASDTSGGDMRVSSAESGDMNVLGGASGSSNKNRLRHRRVSSVQSQDGSEESNSDFSIVDPMLAQGAGERRGSIIDPGHLGATPSPARRHKVRPTDWRAPKMQKRMSMRQVSGVHDGVHYEAPLASHEHAPEGHTGSTDDSSGQDLNQSFVNPAHGRASNAGLSFMGGGLPTIDASPALGPGEKDEHQTTSMLVLDYGSGGVDEGGEVGGEGGAEGGNEEEGSAEEEKQQQQQQHASPAPPPGLLIKKSPEPVSGPAPPPGEHRDALGREVPKGGMGPQRRSALRLDDVALGGLSEPIRGFQKTSMTEALLRSIIDDADSVCGTLFAELDGTGKARAVDSMFRVTVQPGAVVMKQGEEGDLFYCIETGELDIYVDVDGRRTTKCSTLGPGGAFGEFALLHESPRPATVQAKEVPASPFAPAPEPVVLWALQRAYFQEIMIATQARKRTERVRALRKVPVLEDNLDPVDIGKLADALEEQEFAPGEVLIMEGTPISRFFVISQGGVVLSSSSSAEDMADVATSQRNLEEVWALVNAGKVPREAYDQLATLHQAKVDGSAAGDIVAAARQLAEVWTLVDRGMVKKEVYDNLCATQCTQHSKGSHWGRLAEGEYYGDRTLVSDGVSSYTVFVDPEKGPLTVLSLTRNDVNAVVGSLDKLILERWNHQEDDDGGGAVAHDAPPPPPPAIEITACESPVHSYDAVLDDVGEGPEGGGFDLPAGVGADGRTKGGRMVSLRMVLERNQDGDVTLGNSGAGGEGTSGGGVDGGEEDNSDNLSVVSDCSDDSDLGSMDGDLPFEEESDDDDDYDEKNLEWEDGEVPGSEIKFEDLEQTALLGHGSFGAVKLVRLKSPVRDMRGVPTRHFALKCMQRYYIVDNGWEDMVENERAAMVELSNECDFLLQLWNTYQDRKYLYLLLELCTGGELYEYQQALPGKCFNEESAAFYSACITEGLKVMHAHNIVFRDLKPENLIMDHRG